MKKTYEKNKNDLLEKINLENINESDKLIENG